jgi:hypothetical protein
MKVGDHVDVYISTGEKVGPGKIIRIVSNDPMAPVAGTTTIKVIVERPRGGPYEFGASQHFFQQVAPDRWEIYMPAPSRGEFLLDEENNDP